VRATQKLLARVIATFLVTALIPLRSQEPPGSSRVNSGWSPSPMAPREALSADLSDYEISPDDLLYVYVFDVPELSREYRVSPNGSIQMPLLADPIPAAGLTRTQLSDLISERLRKSRSVGNPKVTVDVKESRVHSIAITGAVKRPQIYRLFGQTTLLDLLSQAEGLDSDAGATAVITRGQVAQRHLGLNKQGDLGATVTQTADLQQLLEGGDNPVLYPQDRVTIPHAGIFYVLGAVIKPGGYNLRDAREQMTVLMAVATAGDLTSTAKSDNCLLIRKKAGAKEGKEEIVLNVKQIRAGRMPDPRMQASDILYIPESGGKKAAHAALGAMGAFALSTTSGVIIYRR
jgi:polysaccharide biosynthesis/export protein